MENITVYKISNAQAKRFVEMMMDKNSDELNRKFIYYFDESIRNNYPGNL